MVIKKKKTQWVTRILWLACPMRLLCLTAALEVHPSVATSGGLASMAAFTLVTEQS